jgi:hypothetical protein
MFSVVTVLSIIALVIVFVLAAAALSRSPT